MLQQNIRKHFNPAYFDSVYDEYKKSYMITDKIQNKLCAELFWRENSRYIEINQINKCTLSGNEILNQIEKLAKEVNIEYIMLKDWSSLLVSDQDIHSLDLIILTILTNGKSWYNNHGYISTSYESELHNNNLKLKMKFGDFYVEAVNNLFQFAFTHWKKVIDEMESYENKKILLNNLSNYLEDGQKNKYVDMNREEIIEQFKKHTIIMLDQAKSNNMEKLAEFEKLGYDIQKNVSDLMKDISVLISSNSLNKTDIPILTQIFNMCYSNIDYDRVLRKKIV